MLAGAAALVAVAGSLAPASATIGKTERASERKGGGQANGPSPAITVPDLTSPAMSLDGRYVAFSSDATNLVEGDSNGVADVFVKDRGDGLHKKSGGGLVRASGGGGGKQANGPSYSPAMSVDGRWLAFVSEATNLVQGDTNGVADVFLRDMKRGTIRLVSRRRGGAQANGPSNRPFVSLYGDWITFDSAATNLAAGDDNRHADAFVYTRRSRAIERIVPPAIEPEPSSPLQVWTEQATIGYNGRHVAYLRRARRAPLRPLEAAEQQGGPEITPDVAGDGTSGMWSSDVLILNRDKDTTRMVRAVPRDGKYRMFFDAPALAADGRHMAMVAWSVIDSDSAAKNVNGEHEFPVEKDGLAANPLDQRNVYLYDRVGKGAPQNMSRGLLGLPADGDSYNPQISSQGHAIAFASDATNLIPGDGNGATDVFLVDTRERALGRVSVGPKAAEIGGASTRLAMSYDAQHVVFASADGGVATGDSNAVSDVFVHDRTLIPNRAPILKPLERDVYTVNPLEETHLKLKARDRDDDPLRFGIPFVIAPVTELPAGGLKVTPKPTSDVPDGMSIDPRTGDFRWTPAPAQAGPWVILFWVGDPRGAVAPADAEKGIAGSYLVVKVVVRSASQFAACTASATC